MCVDVPIYNPALAALLASESGPSKERKIINSRFDRNNGNGGPSFYLREWNSFQQFIRRVHPRTANAVYCNRFISCLFKFKVIKLSGKEGELRLPVIRA